MFIIPLNSYLYMFLGGKKVSLSSNGVVNILDES